MTHNCSIVLTGAMGGGKSTVLKALSELSTVCVAEPARKILFEQRAIEAAGVPEKDPSLFTMLMLSRSIHDYNEHDSQQVQVIFDRGIPDMVAYAKLFGIDALRYEKAAALYRYNKNVFYFPPWKEIYTHDEERKIDFEGAKEFGIRTKKIYQDFEYNIVEVPLVSIEERVRFVLEKLEELKT